MLGPMPIASSLGIGRPPVAMAAPFALGLGGNAITLSLDLFAAARQAATNRDVFARFEPAEVGQALAAALRARHATGGEPPTIAIVHPFSAHNYDVRYWLSASGVDPDNDVRLIVLPPVAMVEALRERRIDGFCAGEPWNSLAVAAGVGAMAVTTSALRRQGPDKVLGMRTDFADRHPSQVAALLRALFRSAQWAGEPGNHDELAALLAGPAYIDAPADVVQRALHGRMVRVVDGAPERIEDFLVFDRYAATFPWLSHALWFYAQMTRWGHVAHSPDAVHVAAGVYRPDLYRAALAPIGADLPRANAKVEGALPRLTPVASRFGRLLLGPDGFFDDRPFDPDDLEHYIRAFANQPGASAE